MKTNNVIGAMLLLNLIFACQKEDDLVRDNTTISPEKQTTPKKQDDPQSTPPLGGPTRPTYYRYYNQSSGYCVYLSGSCLPDVIILGNTICHRLDDAIAEGSVSVAKLFQDELFAVSFIPSWNNEEFAESKAAILSGNYTFIKNESPTGLYYFGGEKSELTLEHYDLVFPVVIR